MSVRSFLFPHSDGEFVSKPWGGAGNKTKGGHLTLVGAISLNKQVADALRVPVFVLPHGTAGLDDIYWASGSTCKVSVPMLVSRSGWMTIELWESYARWLCKQVREVAGVTEPYVLFLDNCGAHLSPTALRTFRDANIHVITFPSRATHIMQMLDLRVFGVFMKRLRAILKAYVNRHFQGDLMRNKLTPKIVIEACQAAWEDATTPHRVAESFRCTGIAPLDVAKVDNLLQITTRRALHVESESVHTVVPPVIELRSVFGEGVDVDPIMCVDEPQRSTLDATLRIFFEVNSMRLLEPFMQFGQELLERAEAADYGMEGYVPGSLVLPPRMVLGPAHTPRPKPTKIAQSVLQELSGKVMTSDDVISVLDARAVKSEAEAADAQARKAKRDADSATRKAAAEALAAAKAEILASEAPLREYARKGELQVSDTKKLTVAQLKAILTQLNPDASKTGTRDALVTSCLEELASLDS